jgi:rSAM/selenodomain-associated transferase 2
MKYSIIIPTLNESRLIGEQVTACLALKPCPEVIVADGGSADGTPRLAQAAGARLVASPRRGRGPQMNAGAAVSRGDLLIFLHADVILPQTAYDALGLALRDPKLVGGAFRRHFDSPSRLLEFGCRLADFRGRWFHRYLGDQTIFVRQQVFEALGRFPEFLLFEDLAFSRKMARLGRTRLIDAPVVVSSRRFDQEGNLRRLAGNLQLEVFYFLGADPNHLALRYYPGSAEMPSDGALLAPAGCRATPERSDGVAAGTPAGGRERQPRER